MQAARAFKLQRKILPAPYQSRFGCNRQRAIGPRLPIPNHAESTTARTGSGSPIPVYLVNGIMARWPRKPEFRLRTHLLAADESPRCSHFCDAFVGKRGINTLIRHMAVTWRKSSNKTRLPVEEAREGAIFPDHLYVIIPNTTLTITRHVLHLTSRDPVQRPHRPVDTLFFSLAEERRSKVIGVILSGSGSDGAKGIEAIKEAGGLTFAEGEESASFFGMPSSAIRTGCVDFILNPCDIARRLTGLSRHVS
jgi:hypothetical protein